MTEKELKSINTTFGIDFVIDKLPVGPKFTKEQMISEANRFYKDDFDPAFAQRIESTIQKNPDAKIYVYFKKDFLPISNIDDIINIPGLLNHLETRIELDYVEYDEKTGERHEEF